ncbi:hypothetical protein JXB31_01525 [Candidatus Woesearchaeota archaeon]|nr:hypothetical protein [Candidatus Woesearchaeota archaeon]
MADILIAIALAYLFIHLFLFFVVSRLLVPFLGFSKEPMPKTIPAQIKKKIDEIKRRTKSKSEFTKESFYFLSKRYKSLWFHTLIRMDIVFLRDLEKIWVQKDFLPCNSHNYLLRIFLVKSGYYDDNQIEIRHGFLNFGIHQYLRVYDGKKSFDLDLWGNTIGVPMGRHASMFKSSSLITDVQEVMRNIRKIKRKNR